MSKPLVLAVAVSLLGGAVHAQTFDAVRSQVQAHQDRMERLRQRGDRLADDAYRHRTTTRLTLLELDDRRRSHAPSMSSVPGAGAAATPDERAAARRSAASSGVGQIDAWLDRNPR